MRVSNRERILGAIVDIVQRDGVNSVTFDAIASETGLTRGGLLYHFPSREELLLATHESLANRWEKGMIESAGKDASSSTPEERAVAYAQTCAKVARRVELLLMLECTGNPALNDIWMSVTDRWAPPVPAADDPAAFTQFLGRLAADGLWLFEALSPDPIPVDIKRQLVETLVTMAKANQD